MNNLRYDSDFQNYAYLSIVNIDLGKFYVLNEIRLVAYVNFVLYTCGSNTPWLALFGFLFFCFIIFHVSCIYACSYGFILKWSDCFKVDEVLLCTSHIKTDRIFQLVFVFEVI